MGTCIITGASAGIGRAASIEIAKLGEFENIIIISRRKEELEITKSMMSKDVNVDVSVFDMESIDKIPDFVESIYKK